MPLPDFVLNTLGEPPIDLLRDGRTNPIVQVMAFSFASLDFARYQYAAVSGTLERDSNTNGFTLYVFDNGSSKPMMVGYYRVPHITFQNFERQLPDYGWIVFHKWLTATDFEWHLRRERYPRPVETAKLTGFP
jgi:hypothetical protein